MVLYHKHFYRTLIIAVAVLFSVYLVFGTGLLSINTVQREVWNTDNIEKIFGLKENGNPVIAVGTVMHNSEENENSLLIKWWHEENTDTYYLFVPTYLMTGKLHWIFTGADEIYIDEKAVNKGDMCYLKSGTHEVTANTDNGMEAYKLEVMSSSAIASIFMETDSGVLSYLHESKENYEGGKYTLFNEKGAYAGSGIIENMHCRGNASWEDTDKKSYQIKLDKKTDILGMGKAKKWLLLANAFDNTLLRNATALDMAKELQLEFTPETRFADIYINGEYAGNYLITEKIEIDENRVNIRDLEKETELLNPDTELSEAEFFMEPKGSLFSTKGYLIENEPEDISDGYLLELEMSDRYGLEASGFITSRMQPVVFTSPKYASNNQVAYVSDKYQAFEDAVFSDNGYNPDMGGYYQDYIDTDSFARKYLIEEITKNLDAAFTSQYLYIPENGDDDKFYAGPAWDYDKAIAGSGITQEGIDLHDAQGLYAAVQTKDSDIWYALYSHKDFRQKVAQIFMDDMKPIIKEQIKSDLPQKMKLMTDSAMMNSIRWNTFPECTSLDDRQSQYIQKSEELISFLYERMEYLENLWKEETLNE